MSAQFLPNPFGKSSLLHYVCQTGQPYALAGARLVCLVHALQVPEGKVQRMVEQLVEAEVIEVMTDGSGQPAYRFQVGLFRRWVERHAARAEVEYPRSQLR